MSSQTFLLHGGTLIDGSGAPAYLGDLLVSQGKITELGTFDAPDEATTINCAGLAVCPGFIDAHSHSDLQVIGDHPEKIQQGVTAEVVGNCGFSPYPAVEHTPEIHRFANGIFCGDDHWGWASAQDYLSAAEQQAPYSTVASLVGHGTMRIAFAGPKLGPLSALELDRMEGFLREALQEGAAGLSTGLMYAPGSSAPTDELERLCRVVAQENKIYCSHIRDYSFHLEEAVDEQIALARNTGCRLQISHLQTVGQMNWGHQERVLRKIEAAREDGIDVAFDCYPYVAGSTVLTQLLPQWTLDGGIPALLARLANPSERARIADETVSALPQRWNDIVISAVKTAANQSLVGLTLLDVAQARDEEPVEAMLRLLEEEAGEVNMISFNQSEGNLQQTLSHPLSVIISDGFYVKGRPHPRLYGTFPRLLGTISRERQWMPLETAVHKITGRPAARFSIKQRGFLRKNYIADLALFNPATVDSPATFEQPELRPVGIEMVFRNGQPVWPKP
jgi:N-acyl-D-amino-acid deacylase